MKTILVGALALGLMGAAAAPADAQGISIRVGSPGYHGYYGHHYGYGHDRYWRSHYRHHRERYCSRWEWRHHARYCRGWGWRY